MNQHQPAERQLAQKGEAPPSLLLDRFDKSLEYASQAMHGVKLLALDQFAYRVPKVM